MGLFDSILKSGMRAANSAINRAVKDVVYDTVHEAVDSTLRTGVNKTKEVAKTVTSAQSNTASATQALGFSEKLSHVVSRIGEFEIRNNISPDVLEQEAGRQLYTRSGYHRLPKDISYAIYKDGQRVLFVNTWELYEEYKHCANRQLREYCNQSSTPMMDFFEYLPNEIDYMEDRLRKVLG